MALIYPLVPKSPVLIVEALAVVFVVGIQAARFGYVDKPSKRTLSLILVAHAALLTFLGWVLWPQIIISPERVSFAGYAGETFNFSVRNGRADDVYDVQIPFLIGYGKHYDSKFSVKVMPNGDPPQRIYGDSNYCYGKGPDVHKILPNEQEVLIVNVTHIPPYGSRSFSITYGGGESIQTKAGHSTFLSEPRSYSDWQGTMGVRGDFRICRYDMHTDGLVK